MKNQNKGFTLLELLVVIAIIGILSAVVVISLSSARYKAKVSSVKASMQSISSAANVYRTNTNDNYGPSGFMTVYANGSTFSSVDLCNSSEVLTMIKAISKTVNNYSQCIVGVDGNSYVIYTLLPSTPEEAFCTDSSGFLGIANSMNLAEYTDVSCS